MLKFLLSAALATSAFMANADFTDYYKVYYNGEPVENGATIYCNHFRDDTALSQGDNVFNMGYTYEAILSFINQTEDPIILATSQGFLDLPTQEEWEESKWDYVDDTMATKWGTPALCYANAGVDGAANQCVMMPSNAILPDSNYDGFEWQFHLNGTSSSTPEIRYTLTTKGFMGDIDYSKNEVVELYEEYENSEFSVTIVFSPNRNAAVEGIESDSNVAPVYYDLQGRRVEAPAKGLYIVKKGNKVSKEYIR